MEFLTSITVSFLKAFPLIYYFLHHDKYTNRKHQNATISRKELYKTCTELQRACNTSALRDELSYPLSSRHIRSPAAFFCSVRFYEFLWWGVKCFLKINFTSSRERTGRNVVFFLMFVGKELHFWVGGNIVLFLKRWWKYQIKKETNIYNNMYHVQKKKRKSIIQ